MLVRTWLRLDRGGAAINAQPADAMSLVKSMSTSGCLPQVWAWT